MNGNDVVEFEEMHRDRLSEEFVKQFGEEPEEGSQQWHDFVVRECAEYQFAEREREDD